jgi:CPA1 family monovalent cation:H+ antiporter
MYFAAEHFHFSGVLAVVSGGLLLSSKRQQMLNYRSRVEGVNVWTNLVFVLNGLIFLLIGLQLPVITRQLGEVGLGEAILYGLGISFVLIITRLFCMFGAGVFTKFMSHFITVADTNPGWKMPLLAGWAGMRGVVSLAAALSIPVMLDNGQAFPHRNLILFITFVVILVTLVLQGLTFPWLIRKVNPEDKFSTMSEQEQERIIQKKIAHFSLAHLEEKFPKEKINNQHLENLMARLKLDLNFFQQDFTELLNSNENPMNHFQRIYLDMLDRQRKLLNDMNHRMEFDEELIRKYMGLIDMEEYKIREKMMENARSVRGKRLAVRGKR